MAHGSGRKIEGRGVAALLLALSVATAVDAHERPASKRRPRTRRIESVVHVEQGDLRGVPAGTAFAFSGIPYAQPPVGELRWRPPAPPARWAGVRDAVAFSNRCPQVSNGAVVGHEDCLALNVWAPAESPAAGRPVVVWLHQGGNHQGSAFMNPAVNGQYWAESQGVVFVSVAYRLGAFGFLAHADLDAESKRGVSGNYGILDQIAALRWIRSNITAFGGDPSQVTLLGESAGADDICVLMTSPLSSQLFARAIMESSYTGCRLPSLAEQEATTGASVVDRVGCGAAPDVASCLRALPTETLVMALPGRLDLEPRVYSPNVDGVVVPDVPLRLLSRINNATAGELIIGSNAEETSTRVGTPIPDAATYEARILARYGASFADAVLGVYPASRFASPQDAYIAATTDEIHTCPTRRIARTVAQKGQVHRFLFTHAVENDATLHAQGAYHTAELNFLFRVFSAFPFSEQEVELADTLADYWGSMARTGQPNVEGRLYWPEFDKRRESYLELDTTPQVGRRLRADDCDFWDAAPLPWGSGERSPKPRHRKH
jgi:para-nitrobenzyl esterase